MRILIAAAAILGVWGMTHPATAFDETLESEILRAYEDLVEAYELQDMDAIAALSTPDHVAITPLYGGAISIDEQSEFVAELDVVLSPVGEVIVESLAPDIALQTLTVDFASTFQGEADIRRAAVTIIWVWREGQWRQRLYQETTLAP